MVYSLKDEARGRGLIYGSDSDVHITTAPAPYKALFLQQAELYGANLSWGAVTPNAPPPDPQVDDPNNAQLLLPVTSCHLIWHQALPAWVAAITDQTTLQNAMTAHINGMGTAYAGKVFSWNVVNEAIDPPEGRPDGLRNDIFTKLIGYGYLDFSFKAARAANAPNVLLVLNDHGLEPNTALAAQRRATMLTILQQFKSVGTPCDALGVQAHLNLTDQFDGRVWADFLAQVSALGYKILITEFDVNDTGFMGTVADRDEAVANLTRRFMTATLANTAVVSVVTWGLSDLYSWIKPANGFTRADGMPSRPLPFDAAFQPKLMFNALLLAIMDAPLRP